MSNFLLRNVDDPVWAAFRDRAYREGHTLRWVLLTLLESYIAHGLPGPRRTEHS